MMFSVSNFMANTKCYGEDCFVCIEISCEFINQIIEIYFFTLQKNQLVNRHQIDRIETRGYKIIWIYFLFFVQSNNYFVRKMGEVFLCEERTIWFSLLQCFRLHEWLDKRRHQLQICKRHHRQLNSTNKKKVFFFM